MDLSIKPVIDKKDSYYSDMGNLPHLPFKVLCVGKSHLSGKTTIAVNFFARLYDSHFEGKNMYIISKSIGIDNKIDNLIKVKEIPSLNLYKSYDDKMLGKLYDMLESQYKLFVTKGEKPPNLLFYFDDVSYDGSLKRRGGNGGIYNKIFMNGRHINASCFSCIQAYTDALLNARRNLTALIFFNVSDKDLDLILDEHLFLSNRKEFKKRIRKSLKNSKHNFICVNYSQPLELMYQNEKFEPIDISDLLD